MRILIVSDSYPPLIGGATRFVRQLAEGLRDRGHVLAVATAAQDGHSADTDADEIEVFRIADSTSRLSFLSSDETRHTPPPWTDPPAWRQLHRAMTRFRPDVVFSYGWLSYAASLAAAGTRTPFILSTQDYGQVCPKRTLLYRDGTVCSGPAAVKCARCAGEFYGVPKGLAATVGVFTGARVLATRIDGITYASTYMQDTFRRCVPHLFAPRPGVAQAVIPAFAEPSPGEAGPDETVLAGLPDEYLMYVGALRKVKGVELLVDAYRSVTGAPPLVLFGTRAPDTPSLDAPGVQVVEGAQNATVMAAWEKAAFGVFPSLWAEPLGIVVHEAMSRGKPAIGTRPSGHSDMITDGQSGFLVSIGDRSGLTAAMQTLVDDTALRTRMGAAAREAARRFESARLLDEFEAFFTAVATRSGQPVAS